MDLQEGMPGIDQAMMGAGDGSAERHFDSGRIGMPFLIQGLRDRQTVAEIAELSPLKLQRLRHWLDAEGNMPSPPGSCAACSKAGGAGSCEARIAGSGSICHRNNPGACEWVSFALRILEPFLNAAPPDEQPPPSGAIKPRVEVCSPSPQQRSPRRSSAKLLSGREEDVLALLGRGMSTKGIARSLGVSPGTVKWHLRNIYGKLSAPSREWALAKARELGILA